jgi:hypothetical protein
MTWVTPVPPEAGEIVRRRAKLNMHRARRAGRAQVDNGLGREAAAV